MLPEVGSTIVPPGCSSPEASAASIIRRGDAVLHRPAGVEVLHLRQDQRAVGAPPARSGEVEGPAEPDERGVADQVEERVHVLHPANLAVYRSVAVTAGCVASGRGGNWSSTQAGIGRRPGRRRTLRARRRALRGPGRRGEVRAAADRQRDRRTSARDGLVRPRPAGPGDPDRPARRLQRRRLRRRAGRGHHRRPPRHAASPRRPTAGCTCAPSPSSARSPARSPTRSTPPSAPTPTSPSS